MLASNGFIKLHPSALIDMKQTWPKKQITYPLTKNMSDANRSLFNCGRWNELKRFAFLTVKHHNPENLVFEHLSTKEKTRSPYKNDRLEEIKRMRIGIIMDTLTSVDIVEIVKCGGIILEVFHDFSVVT